MKKQIISQHDDEYILISKRRYLAGNLAIASMAKFISAIQNCSIPNIVQRFAQFGVNESEAMSQADVDAYIKRAIEAQNSMILPDD